jgi:hypothetical protein
MNIINNFLPFSDFKNLEKNILHNDNFPWYFSDGVNTDYDGNFQFTHTFYKEHKIYSNLFDFINPILSKLEITALLRIKANLTTKNEKLIEHGFHNDFKFKKNMVCTTAIYYLNDNNGYTKFKDGTKILSEANKLIYFNSDLEHSGTNCTDSQSRVVINLNYF